MGLRLDSSERQVDLVAALVEHPQHRVERAHGGRVLHDEENLHGEPASRSLRAREYAASPARNHGTRGLRGRDPAGRGARLGRVTAPPQTPRYSPFLDAVDRFEGVVLAQRPAAPAHYDDEYFTDAWREGGNRYELDTRRRIEDRNPALIKEAFQPTRVLDVGCGPGFLMLFLAELGIEVEGIDFSPTSQELAPPEIRERILVGDVAEAHVAERSFDLVICREVLEHLTVLQVRRTVEQLCRASSRFVYVTTRFHPDPAEPARRHDRLRDRPDPHQPARQGLRPLPVRARGVPEASRPRGADGLGGEGPRPGLRARGRPMRAPTRQPARPARSQAHRVRGCLRVAGARAGRARPHRPRRLPLGAIPTGVAHSTGCGRIRGSRTASSRCAERSTVGLRLRGSRGPSATSRASPIRGLRARRRCGIGWRRRSRPT